MVGTKAILPGLTAGLLLIACAACGGGPAPWTSHATFTIGNDPGRAGTFHAADSTVPRGTDGAAVIYLDVGGSPRTEQFDVTIGDDPGQGTNASQFRVLFLGYHGPGTYVLQAGQPSTPDVGAAVRDFKGSTNKWSMDQSPQAVCTVRVSADRATKVRTVRRIAGSISCRRLYDLTRRSRVSTLSGHFNVFAQVACGGFKADPPCASLPPGVPDASS